MEERGVDLDHTTLNLRAVEYSLLTAKEARKQK